MSNIYYITPGNIFSPELLESNIDSDLLLPLASEYSLAFGCPIADCSGYVDLSEPFILIA